MKKLILLLLSFLVISSPCFAEYKPIPKHLSKQYKKEMEQIIKQKYSDHFDRIKNYDKVIKNIKPENRYTYIDVGIQSEIFEFLMALIYTTDTYSNILNEIPTTDFWPKLYDILYPYLQNNDINTRLIDKLIKYSNKKENILRKKFLTKNDYLKDFAYLNSNISYNWRTLKYNKFTKRYTFDIAIDTNTDYKECKYPYKNGCISHLIYKTKLSKKNFYIKYKGFIASTYIQEYNNTQKDNPIKVDVIAIKRYRPENLRNLKQIENNIYTYLNINYLKQQLKLW